MSMTYVHDAAASMQKNLPRAGRLAIAVWMAMTSTVMIAPLTTQAAQPASAEKKDEKAEAEHERKLDAARKRLDEAAREVAELSMQASQDAMPRIARIYGSRFGSRAMLGVNIGSDRDDDRKDGVELLGVSPGGAAEQAGLKAGDVIVELKGKSLKQSGDESPREKLLATMRDVKAEEKVEVKYVREGKTATVSVVARPVDRLFTMAMPMEGRRIELPRFSFMRADGMFGSAELVPLTAKLGQYFGADKGLLVIRAPDSRMQLEEGDVIVDIDGRVPSNAAHAFRILGSYQPGEKVKLNVLRMKKRAQIEVTIPEEGMWEGRMERAPMFVPPAGDVLIPAPAPAPTHAIPVPPPPRDAV